MPNQLVMAIAQSINLMSLVSYIHALTEDMVTAKAMFQLLLSNTNIF